ncbi:MAG: sugar kinase [Cenarchaeum sp. SB0664_bin_35]|nr:sugar kinase [Cenarchaeum sp. SB0664_bin_35]
MPNATDTLLEALKYDGIKKIVPGSISDDIGCIIIPGGDKGIRRYFRNPDVPAVPVLGVFEGDMGGFLSQMNSREIKLHIKRLHNSENYNTVKIPRLEVIVDDKDSYIALNDAAVFSAKSAILIEYTLKVNKHEVWHDSGDGIIVSTPMGSTAYSMSTGGPVIFQGADVFGIVPVNSQDVTRRPLVVPSDSRIEVSDIVARIRCEVVIDGADRLKVKENVKYLKFRSPARIIRMEDNTTSVSAMIKKVHLAEDLLRMPPSSKLILKMLEYEGAMSQKDLVGKTLLPARTVRIALARLLEEGYISRKVSILDSRQKIYGIS